MEDQKEKNLPVGRMGDNIITSLFVVCFPGVTTLLVVFFTAR